MSALPRLRRLFSLATSVTAASGIVTACAGGLSREGFDKQVCGAGSYDYAGKVTPKEPVDFIGRTIESEATPLFGTACATAKDKAACDAEIKAFAAEASAKSCGQGPCSALVYTRGDKVGAIRSIDELRAFIDVATVYDAALLASFSGYYMRCEGSEARATATGFEVIAARGTGCGASDDMTEYLLSVSKSGEVTVLESSLVKSGDSSCAVGRRPCGLVARRDEAAQHRGLGAWLATVAHLEAASIPAFERLASALAAHGAPPALAERAVESAADEVRHARAMATLAKRHGVPAPVPEIALVAPPTLFELALDNAVEGCVRETFGALVATHQGRVAESRDLRAVMKVIAEDETRHAALAWDIAAWVEPLLDASERRAVSEARVRAAAELRAELDAEPHRDVQQLAGVPCPSDALSMFDVVARDLWAA